MIKINKHNTSFYVSPKSIHLDWFTDRYKDWETTSFEILDKLLDKSKTFIDIGAHIGLILLYAAPNSLNTIGVECDPIAFNSLKNNVDSNEFKDTVFLEEAAINDTNSLVSIGPAGRKAQWGGSGIAFDNSGVGTKYVNGITINKLESTYNIDNCGLVKIDIEGGESKVLHTFKDFFQRHQSNLFLSVHPHLMSEADLVKTINVLYEIFPYVYDGEFNRIDIETCTSLYISNKKKIANGSMNSSVGQELIGSFNKL